MLCLEKHVRGWLPDHPPTLSMDYRLLAPHTLVFNVLSSLPLETDGIRSLAPPCSHMTLTLVDGDFILGEIGIQCTYSGILFNLGLVSLSYDPKAYPKV